MQAEKRVTLWVMNMDLAVLRSKFGAVFTGEDFDRGNDALINVPSLPQGEIDHGVWGAVSLGYKTAADTLADRAGDPDVPLDHIIYPVVTLYRHYFELSIKHLYVLTGLELTKDTDAQAFTHNILKPWREVLLRLQETPGIETVDDLEVISLVVLEFHEMDKRATTFRYPDLVQRLPEHSRINVPWLKAQMGRASREIESCIAWLLELQAGDPRF